MRKKIILFCILLIAVFIANAQKYECIFGIYEPHKSNILFGKIKTLEEDCTQHKYENDSLIYKGKENGYAHTYFEFDRLQNVVLNKFYNGKDSLLEVETFSFTNNKLSRNTELRFYYNNDGQFRGNYYNITEYVYDSVGYLQKKISKQRNENDTALYSTFINFYHYTPQKKVAFIDYNSTNGRVVFTYDKHGNLLEEKNCLDKLQSKINYIFKFKYDSKNRLIEQNKNSGASYIENNQYNYNSNGTIISSTFKSQQNDSELNYSNTYTYDSFGNIIKSISIFKKPNEKTITSTYQYEFDKNNNWTKRTANFGNVNVEIVTRKITYYK